jgi:ubiquitin carboxyl-terminal hydrolase 25/28
LGTDPTASDNNIIFAYKRQVETDPARTAWYLTFLGQIADMRQSEEIQFEIVLQKSSGRFDLEQVDEAYRYFGFSSEAGSKADDDYILGTYKSRLSDAPRQDSEMREQLRIIGEHRNSAKIKETAKGSE